MKPFIYVSNPSRVVFGRGALAQLEAEIEHTGASRALVLCTPEQRASAERVASLLGNRVAGIFDKATMHVPVEIAREARAEAARLNADCAIAIGGGSTIGLGKAIALESPLPIVAIPTTYAGSEMTPIYGLTQEGLKKTGRDERVRPTTVIYDPDLSASLPVKLSVSSGLNAMAHAAEGLYAHDGNPITELMAAEGIRAMAAALPSIVERPQDEEARSDALYATWLCGTVLGSVAMGLHHKLCHTLGGSFNLPHAEVHAVILPHAMAYNAVAAPVAMERLAHALGLQRPADAPRGLFDLASRLGAPTSLAAIGMPSEGIDHAADLAAATPYPNPRPLERESLRALLQRAFDGVPP